MATFLQKARLLKGLLAGETAYAGPFFVTIDVTRRCNLRCLGCHFHSPAAAMPSLADPSVSDISFDLVERLYGELRTMDTEKIVLIGEGEPLLHPRIFDMISGAKAAGLHVTVVTNGTLLDRDAVESLLASRLDRIQISLWASSPEEYRENYPGSDLRNFERTIEGMKLLGSLKKARRSGLPFIVLRHPINRNNFRTIDAMARLAHAVGCDAVSFSPLKPRQGMSDSGSLSPEEEASLRRRLDGMRNYIRALPLRHNIDEVLLRYRIGRDVRQKLPCYIGWIDARVKADGTVVPCQPCKLPTGNLHRNSLREIWNGSPFRAFRRQTLTREGLSALNQACDCEFCCHLPANARLHRFLKWLSPLVPLTQKRRLCS